MRTAATGLLIVIALSSPVQAFQQRGLPAGPGWTTGGTASLLDDDAPPYVSPLFFRRGTAWLAVARPFGVPGLFQAEAAAGVSPGGLTVGLSWRQVTGDGMRHRYLQAAIRHALEVGSDGEGSLPLGLSLAAGLHTIGAIGGRSVHRLELSLSAVIGSRTGWSLALEGPLDGRSCLRWAAGRRSAAGTLAAGVTAGTAAERESALLLKVVVGRAGVRLGLWGRPPAPAAGVTLPAAGLIWTTEWRWVAGAGSSFLGSVRIPTGDRQ